MPRPGENNNGFAAIGIWARKRWRVFLFITAVAVICSGAFFYYHVEAARAREEKAKDLALVGKMKVQLLLRWRKERADDITRFAASPAVRQLVRQWFQHPEDVAIRDMLLERLRLETDFGLYPQAFFADDNRHVLLSFPKDPDVVLESWDVVNQAWETASPVFGELHFTPSGEIHQDIAMALQDDVGRPLLVVVFTVDVKEFLFPMVHAWPTPSQTAETILVRRKGESALCLNALRSQQNTALTLSFPLSQTDIPVVQAILGKEGTFVGKDHLGKRVLADIQPISGTHWYLVNQQALSEVLAGVRRRAVFLSLVVLLFLFAATAMMGLYDKIQRLEERKKASEDMERLFQRNKLILHSAAEGILGLNTDGKHTFVNPSAAKMLGYEVEELIGSPSHGLWHHTQIDGKPYPKEKCQIYAAYRDGAVHRSSEEVFWRKNGTSFPVEYTSTPIYDAGKLTGAVVTFSDITERKRLERELAQTREMQFRTLLSILPAKVFLKDRNSVYLSCNENYANDLKIKPEQIAGKTDRDFFPGPLAEQRIADDKRVMASGKTESREEEYRILKDAKVSYIQSVKAPILDKSGNVSGLFGLFWDITEQKTLEIEKNRVKAMASAAETKTKFASTVSHELRSPMAVIIAALDIALDGLTGEVNGELKEILTVAKRNSERLVSLIGNILDFQKIESGKMLYNIQDHDPKKVIEEVRGNMEVLARQKGLSLTTQHAEGLSEVKFDREKIIQVLSNLISNAIRHTEKGGIVVSSRKENAELHVQVRDTGSGIPAEDLPKLFQPFQQAGYSKGGQAGGTGLGLAISKEIVLAHHGKMWVESEPGKGSVFHFTLPS